MANKKTPQDIIELEHYFSKYFDAHIAPLADKAVKDADAAFLKEYDQMVNSRGALGALLPKARNTVRIWRRGM
mgnify:CR=1 FL=1